MGKLSQVFCRISALFNKELSIERLVINLGDIPTPQFEEVLTQRLLTQLAEHLIALLAAVPTAVSGEPPFLQHDTDIAMLHDGNNRRRKMGLQLHSSETIPAKEEGVAHQPAIDSSLATAQNERGLVPLFHYLQWGYLSPLRQRSLVEWNTSEGADNWLRSHLAVSSLEQRKTFARYCLQAVPRQRLLQTFSAGSLQAVCRLFLDDKPELTPPAGKPALALCLLLSSLWVCRQPSTRALPAPSPLVLDNNLLPEVAPWLLLLFGYPPLSAASLPWLQPFWQQPVVQQLLASELPKPDFIRVQQQMEEITPQSEMAKRAPQATASERQDEDHQHPTRDIGQLGGTQLQVGKGKREPQTTVPGWLEENRQHPAMDIGQLDGSQLQARNAKQHAQNEMGERQRYTEAAETRSNPTQLPMRSNASLLEQEPLSVSNAGLVLLWPLLPGLLRQLGLLEEQQFSSPQAQLEAVCWLDELIWGDGNMAEWRTPLGKLLCGLPLESPLVPWSSPEPKVSEQLQDWLAAIPAQLPGLQRCQASDLRSLFLQRPGQLLQTRSGWQLSVEADASDFLLSQLPWALDFIRLPWMEKPLQVKWLPAVS